MVGLIGTIVLVGLTVTFAALWLAPRLKSGPIPYGNHPDLPKPFGYKMAWLAIRSANTASIVEALGLDDAIPANWESGIGAVYDDKIGEGHVFVSPPVDGWTFVLGVSLPHPVGKSFVDKLTPMLTGLSSTFGEAQYYFTYPLIDFFAWVHCRDGRLVRAFAVSDEGVVWDKGRVTKQERGLGLTLFELRGVRGRSGDAGGELILYPTERHVLQIAGAWGIDPTRVDSCNAEAGTGFIAPTPSAWRAERASKRRRQLAPSRTAA